MEYASYTTVHRSCDDNVPAIVSTHGQVFAMTTLKLLMCIQCSVANMYYGV
jgi:hypothetical protein